MEKVAVFLRDHRNEAYTIDELVAALEGQRDYSSGNRIELALQALVKLGAFSVRDVQGKPYYAFKNRVKKGSWEPDPSV